MPVTDASKRPDKVSIRRRREPAGRNVNEPASSLVKTKMRRATRYLSGEASIPGCRTDEAARDSSGVSGATCRERGHLNRGGPLVPSPIRARRRHPV